MGWPGVSSKICETLTFRKLLHIPQLSISIQADTSPLILNYGYSGLAFKIQVGKMRGRKTKKIGRSSDISVSQPSKKAAAQLRKCAACTCLCADLN